MARNILLATGNYSVAKSSDREVTFFKFCANLLSKVFLLSLQFDNMIRLVAIHHEDLLADTHIHLAKVQCLALACFQPSGRELAGRQSSFLSLVGENYICVRRLNNITPDLIWIMQSAEKGQALLSCETNFLRCI